MIKYLIVQLSPTSVSFCHNDRGAEYGELISIDLLKKVIVWSMQENLNVQFTFPDEEIPQNYLELIDSIDHISIVSSTCEDTVLRDNADVVVFDSWGAISFYPFMMDKNYVIRTTKEDFFEQARFINNILAKTNSLSIVVTNIHEFKEEDFTKYREIVEGLIPTVVELIKNGRDIHLNLLTDRVLLDKMNNCGAGDETITIAPDGKFYICPAFYTEKDEDGVIGDFANGMVIKNPQLYKLAFAPICRSCDAFQCRRCIWLNKTTTYEVNTPSHEQCVIAHIERNASMKLRNELKKLPGFTQLKEIPQLNYLDPFDKIWYGNQNHNTQLT